IPVHCHDDRQGRSQAYWNPGLCTSGGPSFSAQPRHRASPIRRNLVGDRPAATAQEPRHDADLRQGRYRYPPDIEPAVAGRCAMTSLRLELERYLSMRQGLGYKYEVQARRLRDFVSFMEARKATTITIKLALAWVTLPHRTHASSAHRLTDVRGFARHVASINPKTEIPPNGIFPKWNRPKPYIYNDGEINALLAAALALPPTDGLRRWTYHHLFGLIVVTGMRLSEAMGLQRSDVDLEQGVLTVRQTKFGKSRLLP